MIAAMANLLNYDVYDMELTVVRDNTELRRLLIETTSKSIIVIEDIDCSLDLTGQRKKKKEEKSCLGKKEQKEDENSGRVTLSGLLNVIDGVSDKFLEPFRPRHVALIEHDEASPL